MKEEVWATVVEYNNQFHFTFGRGSSDEIIAVMILTPAQLLQVFQYSGIDFHESTDDLIDIERD